MKNFFKKHISKLIISLFICTIFFTSFNIYTVVTPNKKNNQSITTLNPCNSTNNNYEIKQQNKIPITSNNNPYIKNSKIPKHLYVISQDYMIEEEKTMIATLQGLISNRSESQIYTLNSLQPDYKIWLEDLKNHYGVTYELVENPWTLIKKFRPFIHGYVLYSRNSLKDPSINNACSLASLKNCIAIDRNLEGLVRNCGITNIVKDCRNTDKNWAYDNLWNSGLNHSTVIELSPSKAVALRDYAIMTKSLIFYEDSVSDKTLREKVFKSMKTNGICLGWGPDEHENVSITSKYGISMVASDWSYNLTVLSAFPSNPIKQKPSKKIKKEDNVHYVTIVMSDGDNQQWLLGSNYNSPKWYGSPNRGQFNMGWTISPSLYYLAPTVFKEYYKDASTGLNKDDFLVPPSGMGYIYPSKFPKNKLKTYTKSLNKYMKNVDENYAVIIDDDSFYDNKIWNKFTCHSNIDGLFYLNYHRHDDYHGKISWSNNKPIVSCRDLLWHELEDENTLIQNINDRIEKGYTNVKDPNAYTFIYVHAWSKDMNNIKNVVDKLNKNSKVRVVSPDSFMKLIKENIPH
ncbi:protein phosphatase [Clostridiaceae bacterium 14S0207]|nr:protein phosphatase [Clostridiaceae bacterium 14S0207]